VTAVRQLAAALALLLLITACSGEDGSDGFSDIDNGLSGNAAGPQAASGDTSRDAGDDSSMNSPIGAPEVADDAASGSALSEPLPPLDQPLPEPDVTVGINPWVLTADDRLSTFGFDVDTIAYTRVREAITQGGAVPPTEVRVEEIINAFDYGYPTGDGLFTVTADGATAPWARGDDTYRLMRVGIASAVPETRQPSDLVFVIDTSGSMASYLPLVQDSLRVLVENLDGDDTVAIVEYGNSGRLLLPPTPVDDQRAILSTIDELATGGSTNLEAGLVLGYDAAEEVAAAGRNTRVILLSDGIANVGVTDAGGILDRIADSAGNGVNLLTVGFGFQGFNDPLMEQLANQGDGFSVYMDRIEQAEEVFGERLTTTLQTIAVDARSQVDFNPETVAEYRLIGYENRDIADDDFRNDTVDAGQIGAGHTVTAVYALRLTDRTVGPIGTVAVRWLDPETRDPSEIAHVIDVADVTGNWEDATAGLRLAGATAAWGEVLRESPHIEGIDLAVLADEAARIADAVGIDRVTEWADLVARSIT
jgi:Ca-activated chloride channel homolog